MDEKILIKSERCNLKKLFIMFVIIGLIASLLVCAVLSFGHSMDTIERYKRAEATHAQHGQPCRQGTYGGRCGSCEIVEEHSKLGFVFYRMYDGHKIVTAIVFASLVVIGAVIFILFKQNELTVTDKRVYGIGTMGKRVDLPVDSISSTAKLKWGVAVATSSGTVRFRFLKNSKEIYEILNNLVIERQKKENKAVAPVASTTIIQSSDNAGQLQKFKDLLDSGVITQEEFDAKKKQLLGL